LPSATSLYDISTSLPPYNSLQLGILLHLVISKLDRVQVLVLLKLHQRASGQVVAIELDL